VENTNTPEESTPTKQPPTLDPTASSTALQPSPSVTKTPLATHTQTPKYTSTSSVSFTPTLTDTPGSIITETPSPYILQMMNPYYLENFTHQDLGCDWMGVAGQIFSSGGQVQTNILIKAGGEIDGNPVVEDLSMPLAYPETDTAYGPGGYEITLSHSPAETDSTAWIQLFSLEGDPLSDQIYLVTFDDCQKNLILMNFTER
jgi:hypothetical protein